MANTVHLLFKLHLLDGKQLSLDPAQASSLRAPRRQVHPGQGRLVQPGRASQLDQKNEPEIRRN